MTDYLFHGTRNLARVLGSNRLVAHEVDADVRAVCFSRCWHVATFFAKTPAGGLLVLDRRALRARNRLRCHHMNGEGFILRSESASECEERVLHDVSCLHTALIGWVDCTALAQVRTRNDLLSITQT